MSPGVTNFVHDLVAMAQAMDELPKVKANNAELAEFLEMERQTVQHREERIIALKAEIDTLTQRAIKAEAERDDAQFRFLELSEAFGPVASAVGAALAGVGAVNAIINPSKPVEAPVVTETPIGDMQGSSEADPTIHVPSGVTSGSAISSAPEVATSLEEPSPSPLPQAQTDAAGTTEHPPIAPSELASPTTDASGSGGSEGKYSGRNYFDLSRTEQDSFWENVRMTDSGDAKAYWFDNGGSQYGWDH